MGKHDPVPTDLVTRVEYETLTPRAKGYVVYMQAALPGSELRGERNPYGDGTSEAREWDAGASVACQQVQDAEE